jgi:hypothetical protein
MQKSSSAALSIEKRVKKGEEEMRYFFAVESRQMHTYPIQVPGIRNGPLS